MTAPATPRQEGTTHSRPQSLALEARRVLTDAGIEIPDHHRLVKLTLKYLKRAPAGHSPEMFAEFVIGVLGKQESLPAYLCDPNGRRRKNHITDKTGNEATTNVMKEHQTQ